MAKCVFTEERIESRHTAIKPRSVECCSDVYPSVGFSHLNIWSSTRVTIRFLVTSLDKPLSISSWNSPGWAKRLRELQKLLRSWETSVHQKCFVGLPQICASTQSYLWALQAVPLTSWLGFALICFSSCEASYREPLCLSKSCPSYLFYHR